MDQKLFFLINTQWTTPWLDWAMAVFSSFGIWAPLLFLGIGAGLWFGGFRLRAALVCAVLAVAFNEVVLVKPLKTAFNRPRPHQVLDGGRVVTLRKASPKFMELFSPVKVKPAKPATGPVDGRSFPSGHTSNNFAVTVVFLAFFGWRAWPLLLVALAVSYSRIYTASHWPSDVFFSIFIGSAAGGLTLFWASGFWKRRGPRWFPALYQRYPKLLAASPSPETVITPKGAG